MNAGDRELMAYWVRERNTAQREVEEARQQADLWLRRVELARGAARGDMADEAERRALDARHRWDAAEARLQEALLQIEAVRRQARQPSDDGLRRAAATMEQFRAMGVDPARAEFDALEREARAEAFIARVREEGTAHREDEAADALQRLKARMAAADTDTKGEG